MIQVKNDFFMREAQDIVLLTTSNRTNELFISNGSQSRQDLINAWNLFTSFKEFKEKLIQSCSEGKSRINYVWSSQDGHNSVTIILDGLSKKVNWGFPGKLVPSLLLTCDNLSARGSIGAE